MNFKALAKSHSEFVIALHLVDASESGMLDRIFHRDDVSVVTY